MDAQLQSMLTPLSSTAARIGLVMNSFPYPSDAFLIRPFRASVGSETGSSSQQRYVNALTLRPALGDQFLAPMRSAAAAPLLRYASGFSVLFRPAAVLSNIPRLNAAYFGNAEVCSDVVLLRSAADSQICFLMLRNFTFCSAASHCVCLSPQ